MVDFKAIDAARKVLGLNEVATLKELNNAYRRLSHRYHPDKNRDSDEQMMVKINSAYNLLMAYVADFKYGFTEADVGKTYPFADHMKRFFDD